MKKSLEFVKLVLLPDLKSCFVVMVGDLGKLKPLYDRCVKRTGGASAPKYEEFADDIRIHYESDPTVVASTLHKFGDTYVHLKEWRSGVFVHEAFHAVSGLMKFRGMENEELGAYLIEYLFEEVCNTEKLDGNMRRKLK